MESSLSPMESLEVSSKESKSFLEAPNPFLVPMVPKARVAPAALPPRRLNFEEDSLLPLPLPSQKESIKVYLRVKRLESSSSSLSNAQSSDGVSVPIVALENGNQVALTAPKGSVAYKNANNNKNESNNTSKFVHRFAFTHVFGPEAGQTEVFDTMVMPLVSDFIRCQNQLVFTYGATSSGKTYTLQGVPSEPGIIPRTLDVLFNSVEGRIMDSLDLKPNCFNRVVQMKESDIKALEEAKRDVLRLGLELQLKDEGCYNDSDASSSKMSGISLLSQPSFNVTSLSEESLVNIFPALLHRKQEKQRVEVDESDIVYAVWISFVEIYNEDIFDLLKRVPEQKVRALRTRRERLKLAEDRDGSIYVKDLTEIKVNSANEAYQLMMIGRKNLQMAATRLNHNSSRSHCIFNIKVIHLPKKAKPHFARVSMFTFCDLAGSERQNKTLNTGDRQKESGSINASLLVLGRCIKALRQNQALKDSRRNHVVPFRDSKLTRMFQNFFKGHGKAAMMVNVSQNPNLFDEAIQVLKFAAIASKVQMIRKPELNIEDNRAKQRRKTRFSIIVTKQHFKAEDFLNGRACINWEEPNARSTILTSNENTEKSVSEDYEESAINDSTMHCVTPRVDSQYDNLAKLVDDLRAELNAERQEKVELESQLRKELCSEFNEIMVKVDSAWEQDLKSQKAEAEELSEWRIGKLQEALDDAKRELRDVKKSKKRSHNVDDTIAFSREEFKIEMEEKLVEIRCLNEKNQALSHESQRLRDELNEVKVKLSQEEAKTKETRRLRQEFEVMQSMLGGDEEKENGDSNSNENLKSKLRAHIEQVSANEEMVNNLRRLLDDATKDFLQQEQEIERLMKEKKSLQIKVSEQESNISDQKANINDLDSQLEALISTSRTEIDELKEEKARLEDELDKLRVESSNQTSSLSMSQARLERELNDEIESLRESSKKLRDHLEIKDEEVNKLSEQLQAKEEDIAKLEREVKNVLKADTESKSASEITIRRLRKELQEEKGVISELRSKTTVLELQVTSLQKEDMAFKTIRDELQKRCEENKELTIKLENLNDELKGKEYEVARMKEEKEELMKHYDSVAKKQRDDFVVTKNECLRLRETMATMTPKKEGGKASLPGNKLEELHKENEMLRRELSTKSELIKTLETVVKDQNEDNQKTLNNAEELESLIKENSSLKSEIGKQQAANDTLLKQYKDANLKLQNELKKLQSSQREDSEDQDVGDRRTGTEVKRSTRGRRMLLKRHREEPESDQDNESKSDLQEPTTSSSSMVSLQTSGTKRVKKGNTKNVATEVSFADTSDHDEGNQDDEKDDDSNETFRLRRSKRKVSRSQPVKTRRQPPRAAALKRTPYPGRKDEATDDDDDSDDCNDKAEKSSLKTPGPRHKWYTPHKGEMVELTPVSTEEKSVDVHATVSRKLQQSQRRRRK